MRSERSMPATVTEYVWISSDVMRRRLDISTSYHALRFLHEDAVMDLQV